MDGEFWEVSKIFFGIVSLIAVGVVALLIPIRQIGHHLSVSQCHTFSAASGYETKFVDYNFADWDCLAKTSDGRWIPTSRLHDVNVEGR